MKVGEKPPAEIKAEEGPATPPSTKTSPPQISVERPAERAAVEGGGIGGKVDGKVSDGRRWTAAEVWAAVENC